MPLLKPYSLNASVRNPMELWKLINSHYTTPRLAMDDPMLKADIAKNDLSLKSYSDRLVQTV